MSSAAGDQKAGCPETSTAAQQDIYPLAVNSKALFSEYLKTTREYTVQVSECEWRFLRWTRLLGALAHEEACLDRRLQSNAPLKDLTVSMLVVLKRNLERGTYSDPFGTELLHPWVST